MSISFFKNIFKRSRSTLLLYIIEKKTERNIEKEIESHLKVAYLQIYAN
jgi:hypothetical protein